MRDYTLARLYTRMWYNDSRRCNVLCIFKGPLSYLVDFKVAHES